MITSSIGSTYRSTIVGGVIELFHHGAYAIAGIVFLASVVIPVSKFLLIGLLALSIQFRLPIPAHTRIHLYEAVEFVGRWSMVDVFVVAILTALIQMGFFASINPGPAAVFFAHVGRLYHAVGAGYGPATDLGQRRARGTDREMTDAGPHDPIVETPKAEKASRRISAVWLVPLLALLISLGVAWRSYSDRGPTIEILLDGRRRHRGRQDHAALSQRHRRRRREPALHRRTCARSSPPCASTRTWSATSTPARSSGWCGPRSRPRASSGIETDRLGRLHRGLLERRGRPAGRAPSRRCRARRSPPPTSRAGGCGCARPTAARSRSARRCCSSASRSAGSRTSS